MIRGRVTTIRIFAAQHVQHDEELHGVTVHFENGVAFEFTTPDRAEALKFRIGQRVELTAMED